MQQKVLNGRYELEQKIGEGGMARVYRGRDLRLNRRVAIKVLHSHFADDPSFLNRFQHEAQAAAILSHPNVVDVYDVGQDGNIHYIVMEYVEGQDLKALINREAPLPVERAVAIAEAVALGLATAHRVGLVHRDIKPQNIMVAPDGHVRITDFGIAKSHLSTAMTETGVTFGTADYIAPEQAQGQLATPQSDIYSLGVVLYEMLTNRLPFTGDNAIAVAMQHISSNPIPLHSLNPGVPPQLESLVMRAMAKDPAQRPTSAQEFARLLHNYRTLSVQDTAVGTVVRVPGQQQVRQQVPPRPNTGTTSSRVATPPPPRATRPKAPQQQGVGCGGFVIGFLLLAVVLGVVLLFTTGIFDTLFSASAAPVFQPPTAVAVAPSVAPTEARTPTLAPTITPTVSPTPTISPTLVPLVAVPDVAGKNENDARQELLSLKLFPVLGGKLNNDTVPAGSVISQTVQPGTQLAEGQPVTFTVSLGPELITVPDFVRASVDFAASRSQQLGLRIQVEEQSSTDVDEGFVISQTPRSQSRVPPDTVIQLVVSRGDKVLMPKVKGLTEPEAKALIERTEGLTFSYSDFQGRDRLGTLYDQVAPNVVVSSDPAEGTWVNRGTAVTLGVRAP